MRLGEIAKKTSLNLKMISEDELTNLHKVLLIMLDDLLEICRINNLHFILIGGSAIGALRGKGFIAWDDDIDIAMPRKDFEELYQIIMRQYSNKYSVLHPQNRDNYGRILPKIRLKGTEYRTILEYDLDESGIFIDIYMIENIPDNKIARNVQGFICMFMGFALSCRRMFKGYKVFKNYQGGISFKIKAVIGAVLSFASLEQWARWTDYWYSYCKNDQSKMVGVPADDFHYFGEIYRRNEFCQYIDANFEGRICSIPSNYDPYLRRRYGDYMAPPEAEGHDRNWYLAYNLGKYKKEIL